MEVIEIAIDGKKTTFAKARRGRKAKTPTKLKPGCKEFGLPSEETAEQLKERKLTSARQRLRKRLLTIVREAMKEGEAGKVDLAKLKIAYELLLKDEAAEFEQGKSEGAGKPLEPVVVTQEEMTVYVRRLLGKEITL